MIRYLVFLQTILLVCLSVAHGQIQSGASDSVPFVELPFAATKISMSTDGKWALAWNVDDVQAKRTSLAVIDVRNRRLVSQAILGEPILDAVIGDFVYTVSKSKFCALSREQLTVMHSAVPQNKVMQEALRGKHKLQLIEKHHLIYGPIIRFETPELQSSHRENQPESLSGQTGFGWVRDGILWDKEDTGPRLLVWPAQFRQQGLRMQGVWLHSTPPQVDSWYPFAHAIPRLDVSGVLASVNSVNFPIRLAVVRTNEGLDLAIAPLDSRDPTAVLKLEERVKYSKVNPKPSLAVGDLDYVVSVEKKVYFGSLERHVRSLPQPFHLVPRQSVFVLPAGSSAQVHYDAEGAKKFSISSPAFEATSTDGNFAWSIAEEVIDQQTEVAIKTMEFREQAFAARDNQALARKCASEARESCQKLFGVEIEGIPLPVQVHVTAINPDGKKSSLVHDFLIDVPLDQFERSLDRAYPKFKRQEVASTEPGEGANPTSRDAVEVSGVEQFIRQLQSRAKVDVPQTEIARLAGEAKEQGDQRQSQRFASWLEEVRWLSLTDLQGNKLQARVLQIFAGQITLSTRDGVEFTVDESQLDDASRATLARTTNSTIPQDNDYWRKFALLQCTLAIREFHENHRGFPNWAIADAWGEPALSWRVLLLPELGYEELFDLFRLNEPWDSEHNTRLLPYMPSVFALDPNLAPGLTSLQTVLDSNSPLTSDYRDARWQEHRAIPVFVEASAARAVAWSKPGELRRADFANPGETLRVRSGGYTVITLEGTARRLAPQTSSRMWSELFDFR